MQRLEHASTPEPPYYTLDTRLFIGQFRFFDEGRTPVEVRGKAHRAQEQYHLNKGAEQDIRPIPTINGQRISVHLKPYVLMPDVTLTIGVYPQPKHYSDQESVIGEVLASREEPQKREMELGNVQASYYPNDHTLEIWECFLDSSFRGTSLLADNNLQQLWAGTEQFLLSLFPDTKQIVTPWHDPLFEPDEYKAFLQSRNFQPVARAAYGKRV